MYNLKISTLLEVVTVKASNSSSSSWRTLHKHLTVLNSVKNYAEISDLVKDFEVYLVNKNFKPSYHTLLLKHFRSALKSIGYANYADVKSLPAEEFNGTDFFTELELTILFSLGCEDIQYANLCKIMAFTGLRASDAVGLTEANIVDDTISYVCNKTSRPESTQVDQFVLDLIKEGNFGRPKNYLTIHRNWVAAAGLNPDTTTHVFRHSYASNLINTGVDIGVIRDRLGHASTFPTYIYSKTLTDYISVATPIDRDLFLLGKLNIAHPRDISRLLSLIDSTMINEILTKNPYPITSTQDTKNLLIKRIK